MGSCCCSNETDEEVVADEKGQKGVSSERHCTDVPCLILFVIYLAAVIALVVQLNLHSDVQVIHHARNDIGQHCGLAPYADKQNIFYYDLANDLRTNGVWGKLKGVCVAQCPGKMGDIVSSTDGTKQYFVDTPSSELMPFHRCIPRADLTETPKATLCAWPKCTGKPELGTPVNGPQDVCGPKSEGAETYWFPEQPDKTGPPSIQKQWEADGIELEHIEARMAVYADGIKAPPCNVTVQVVSGLRVVFDGASKTEYQLLLEKYSGFIFMNAAKLSTNAGWIVGLGIGGAVILSMLIILMYSTCVKVALCILVFDLFVVMCFIDYIFFRKAGWNSGQTGARIAGAFIGSFGDTAKDLGINVTDLANHALRDEKTAEMVPVYRGLAVTWTILIVLLFCVLCFIQRQIRIVIALASEAASCLCKMPALIVFPYIGVVSLAGCTYCLARSLLAAMTLEREYVLSIGTQFNIDVAKDPAAFENIQKTICWVCIFAYLWVYFFHMALFTAVIANCVVDWYFYRDDPAAGEYAGRGSAGYFFCKEVLLALVSIFKHDLGTLCFGSFLIALCTMPRLILEYIDQEMRQAGGDNPVTAKIMACAKCCLWCFEKCVKFLTEYAYINNAVTGKSFCRAAHASFVLIAKYPVQVTLNTLVTGFLKLLSCVVVPGALAVASYFVLSEPVGDPTGSGWGISAIFIVFLAFVVTRITVGVYEVCLTTLFVCAMRDNESFGCRYAPDALRDAMGFSKEGMAERNTTLEAEMVTMS